MHPSRRILKLSGCREPACAGTPLSLHETGEPMLEKLFLPENHAIAILMKDHDKVKELFDRFEKAEASAEKEKIIGEALTELKIHAAIEQEIFYPAVRAHVGKDLMNEADEEHHIARVIIAELDRNGRRDDPRDAKFTVLAESVRHHIKEEEGEMLPKAKGLEIDFEALGKEMLARKRELQRNGVPDDAEHAMVAAMNRSGDSPARRARSGGTLRSGSRKAKTSLSASKPKMSRRAKRRKPADRSRANRRRGATR
jgi:hypothetical protein